MKTILKNVAFSNPSKGWNVQVNLFRFHDEKKIRWVYSSKDVMRRVWDNVSPADLESFYDWVHASVDDMVDHVRVITTR